MRMERTRAWLAEERKNRPEDEKIFVLVEEMLSRLEAENRPDGQGEGDGPPRLREPLQIEESR